MQQGQRELLGKRPAPQGAAVGGPAPAGTAPRTHAWASPVAGLGARRAPHTCPAPAARRPGAQLRSPPRPAWHWESARRGSSRAGASPPRRGCAPAGAMRNRCFSGIPENLNPGLSHPCLRLRLQACLFPRGGASPSQRGLRGSLIVHPAQGVREETEKNHEQSPKNVVTVQVTTTAVLSSCENKSETHRELPRGAGQFHERCKYRLGFGP